MWIGLVMAGGRAGTRQAERNQRNQPNPNPLFSLQGGNNNTYCHDDHLNWVDWQQVAADETGFSRFVRRLIHFRHQHPELKRE
jgi:pullulanase/glycogen debranching enzyme